VGGQPGGGQPGQPGGAAIGQVPAQQGADLFAALLKAAADDGLDGGREDERGGVADQMQEARIDVGPGVETRRRDLVAGRDRKGGLQEDRDGAEILRTGPGRVALGRLQLQHEHHAFRQRTRQHRIHPRRGDGVGQVGDDLESCRRALRRQTGQRLLHGVALEQVQPVGKLRHEGLRQVGVQRAVFFHGPHFGAGGEQRRGERAEAGPHLDHDVAGADAGQFERFADDVAVDQKILPEVPLGQVSEPGEQVGRAAAWSSRVSVGRKRHQSMAERSQNSCAGSAAFINASPTSMACAPAARARAASAAVKMPLSLTAISAARKLRDEPLAQGEVGLEGCEIAVVHADDPRAVGDGAGEVGLVVNLEQRVEAGRGGGGVERGDLGVGEGAHDDEDGAGPGLARLQHLDRMHHEILPQARAGRAGWLEMSGHLAQVVERAAKEFCVGQHGEGVGAGRLVTPGLGERGGAGGDVAGGGRAALDLGDHGQPAIRRRRAAANDGGLGRLASSCASSSAATGRTSGAISRRFQAMISVSLSAMRVTTKHTNGTKTRPDFRGFFVCFAWVSWFLLSA
jgi:hypothetical protein